MLTEGTSPVVRTSGDKTLEPNAPWTPDENQKQLTFTFPRLSEVTGIQLTDENVDNSFFVFYKAEGSNEFVPYNNGKGDPEVRPIYVLETERNAFKRFSLFLFCLKTIFFISYFPF